MPLIWQKLCKRLIIDKLANIGTTSLCTKRWLSIGIKKRPPEFLLKVSEGWRLPTLPLGIAVPSALTGLTSLFGMGRGGSPSLLPPFVCLFLACAMVVGSGYHPVYGVRERKNIVYSCYVVNYLVVHTLHNWSVGLLVPLDFDITAFTSAAYQRGSLPRPYMEISSRG